MIWPRMNAKGRESESENLPRRHRGTERTIAKIAGIAKESKLGKLGRIAVIARDRKTKSHRGGAETRREPNGNTRKKQSEQIIKHDLVDAFWLGISQSIGDRGPPLRQAQGRDFTSNSLLQ